MRILFRPEAREDVVAARDWYEQPSAGLGSEFVRWSRRSPSPSARPMRFRSSPRVFGAYFCGAFRIRWSFRCKARISSYLRVFISGAIDER
jgi:hypothetical protein